MSDTDLFLRETLACSISSNQEVRRDAEHRIHEFFSSRQDAIPALLAFAGSDAQDIPLRHLSILLLNQQIQRFWRSYSDEAKAAITSFAFQWASLFISNSAQVSSQDPLYRSATILLAKVFDAGSNQEAEKVASTLATELNRGLDAISAAVDGALVADEASSVAIFSLRCMCEMANESDYQKQIYLLKWCYPRIHGIIESTVNNYNGNGGSSGESLTQRMILQYATKFMNITMRKLGEAKIASGFGSDEFAGVVNECIPLWGRVSFSWLHAYTRSMHETLGRLGIILEVLRSITAVIDCFSHESCLSLSQVNTVSWSILECVREVYVRSGNNTLDEETRNLVDQGYTSDGDRLDIEMLVVQTFDLLCASLQQGQWGGEQHADDMEHIVMLLGEYMNLSGEQVEQWFGEPNDFLAAEADDTRGGSMVMGGGTGGSSLRQAGADVVQEICRGTRGAAYVCILKKVQSLFAEYPKLPSPSPDVTMRLEGILWVFGALRRRYVRDLRATFRAGADAANTRGGVAVAQAAPAQVAELLQSVITFTMALPVTSEHDPSLLLKCRALWAGAELLEIFNAEYSPSGTASIFQYELAAQSVALLAPVYPLALRLQASLTLGRVLNNSKRYAASAAAATAAGSGGDLDVAMILQSCADLSLQANENTVHYPLETVLCAIKLWGRHLPVAAVSAAIQLGLTAWFRYSTDSLVIDVVNALLLRIAKSTAPEFCLPAFAGMLMPHLREMFAGQVAPEQVNYTFVDVLVVFLSKLATISIDSSTVGDEAIAMLSSVKADAVNILISVLRQPCYSGSHSECLQAINRILSHGNQRPFCESGILGGGNPAGLEQQKALLVILGLVFAGVSASFDGNDGSAVVSSSTFGPAVGLLCHLVLKVRGTGEVLFPDIHEACALACQCMCHPQGSMYVRSAAAMGFVHLFARNAADVAQVLLQSQGLASQGHCPHAENAHTRLLEIWFDMHSNLASRYNGIVSSVGLVELISLLCREMSAANGAIALRFLELLLESLPKVLICEEEENGDDFGMDGEGLSDSGSQQRWLGDEDEDEDDYEEWGQGEDGDSAGGGWETESDDASGSPSSQLGSNGMGGHDSPFAPAEMYLSDMIQAGGLLATQGGDDGSLGVNVSDNLVFAPAVTTDPLIARAAHEDPAAPRKADYAVATGELQGRVTLLLSNLRGETGFPAWLNGLTDKSKRLAEALVNA